MSGSSKRGLIGLGAALATAGVVTAAGVAVDRVRRTRGGALEPSDTYLQRPDMELVVIADDGVPLHVEVDEPAPGDATNGPGVPTPTVVFTHGYCLTSECWVLQRRALRRAGYRVVVWDQRGHGRSGRGSRESCTIDQLGEDLFRVIEAVAPDGALALVGHSMGGMATIALGEHHADLVTGRVVAFGCVSTSAGGMPLARMGFATAAAKLLIERLGPGVFAQLAKRPELVRSVIRANTDLEEFLVERYSFASPVPRSIVRLTARMIMGTDLQVMADFAPTFDAYDKTAVLRHFVGVDTLVFNGTEDLLTPPEHSEAIVRLIPGAEHVIIRDAGHVIMLEHPDLLTEQLEALFERSVGARGRDSEVTRKPHVRRVVTPVAKPTGRHAS